MVSDWASSGFAVTIQSPHILEATLKKFAAMLYLLLLSPPMVHFQRCMCLFMNSFQTKFVCQNDRITETNEINVIS